MAKWRTLRPNETWRLGYIYRHSSERLAGGYFRYWYMPIRRAANGFGFGSANYLIITNPHSTESQWGTDSEAGEASVSGNYPVWEEHPPTKKSKLAAVKGLLCLNGK